LQHLNIIKKTFAWRTNPEARYGAQTDYRLSPWRKRADGTVKMGSALLRDNNVTLDTVKTSSEVTVPLIVTGVFGFSGKRVLFLITHIHPLQGT
jgi:hypothetical protein